MTQAVGLGIVRFFEPRCSGGRYNLGCYTVLTGLSRKMKFPARTADCPVNSKLFHMRRGDDELRALILVTLRPDSHNFMLVRQKFTIEQQLLPLSDSCK